MTNNFRNAEVLITGGAGFIGSTLAMSLVEKGARVTIVDAMIPPYGGNMFNLQDIITKIQFLKEDVRDEKKMKKIMQGKDFVFHLAAQTGRLISMEKPEFDFDINYNGTLSVLKAIASEKRNIKLVFASSRGVVGAPVYLPVDENHPTYPRDTYGKNKLKAEGLCIAFSKTHGFSATSLRFNNVYGPRCQIKSNHYGTINLFIRYALEGKVLPIYGDGRQTRDYIYIDDTVDALIRAISKKSDGEIFFVGAGKGYSLLDIVSFIKEEITTVTYTLIPYPKNLEKIDFSRFTSSFEKIEKTLGWNPKIDIKEGIRKTATWYRDYLPYYL